MYRFSLDDGKKSTVFEYFKTKYGRTLRYPHLPCLHVGQRTKNVYVPMECLELMEGQRCAKKLSDKQTAAMIKAVTKPAYQRQRDIVQKV